MLKLILKEILTLFSVALVIGMGLGYLHKLGWWIADQLMSLFLIVMGTIVAFMFCILACISLPLILSRLIPQSENVYPSEKKLLLWESLSAFFLDTELTDVSLNNIKKLLSSEGISRSELVKTFQEEVAPACFQNLYQIAGEWGAFDRDWLVRRIYRLAPAYRFCYKIPLYGRFLKYQITFLVQKDFQRLLSDAFGDEK